MGNSAFAPPSPTDGVGRLSFGRRALGLFAQQQSHSETAAPDLESVRHGTPATNGPQQSVSKTDFSRRVIFDSKIAMAVLDFCSIALSFTSFFIAARGRLDFAVWPEAPFITATAVVSTVNF